MNIKSRILHFIILGILSTSSANGYFDKFTNTLTDFFNNNIGNVGDFIRNKTTSFWHSLTENDLEGIGKNKIQELLNNGRSQIPQRTKDIMQAALLKNLSLTDIQRKIRDNNDASKFEVIELVSQLPTPEEWTRENIKAMGNGIFKLPNNFLLKIRDQDALEEMRALVDRAASAASNKRDRQRFKSLQGQLLRRLKGDPMTWNNETFRTIDLYTVPMDILMKVRPEVIASRKGNLADTGARNSDPKIRRMYLKKILESDRLKDEKNSQKALSIANGLSGLRSNLMPEDFNENVLNDESITNILNDNMKQSARTSSISPQGAKLTMKMFAKLTNITSRILNNKGMHMIGLALPSALIKAENTKAFTVNNIPNINEGIRSSFRPGQQAKLKTLAKQIEKEIAEDNEPVVSNYPEEVISQFSPALLNRVGESDARNILRLNVDLDLGQIGILLNKMNNDLIDVNSAAKELIPSNKLSSLSNNDLIRAAEGQPPGSILALRTSEKFMENIQEIKPNDVTQFSNVLQFIGAGDALKYNSDDILDSLRNMKDINPGFSACLHLKNKLENFTQNVTSNRGGDTPIQLLTGPDMENIPVCVIAAYGPRQISSLTDAQKLILLERFSRLEITEFSILRQSRMAIIKEGLKTMRRNVGLQPGDLDMVGNALPDVPAEELSRARPEIMADYVKKLNDMISMKKMKPCLDNGQRNAIAEMVKEVKSRNLYEWDSVDGVCCLLYTLSLNDLDQLKPEVLCSCNCPSKMPTPSTMATEALCKSALGNQYDPLKDSEGMFMVAQNEAALSVLEDIEEETKDSVNTRRRKRETTVSNDCDKAAYGGTNSFTTYELENINTTVLFSCLDYFGGTDMDQEKAEVLAAKIREMKQNQFNKLNETEIESMGFILKGFSAADLKAFPSFQYGTYDGVVAMLGTKTIFTESQREILADKIKLQWKRPSALTADELILVNQMICGFESPDVSGIPREAFKGATGVLANLKDCPRKPVLTSLAKLAVSTYGDVSKWNKSQVAELGIIVAGLLPEEISALKPEAMEGLSASAVTELNSDSISSMNGDQISYLNPSATFSFTDEQKVFFSTSMLKSLGVVQDTIKSGSQIAIASFTMIFTILIGQSISIQDLTGRARCERSYVL